jgi:hypothetical protein
MKVWKIQQIEGGWWLFYEGAKDCWWHVYHDKWLPVFHSLEEVFEAIRRSK